jgi:hypothetical protein
MALQLMIESGMGMGFPRRFLNLIMDNCISGVSSLRCIDLDKFFNTTSKSEGDHQHATTLALKKISKIQLTRPKHRVPSLNPGLQLVYPLLAAFKLSGALPRPVGAYLTLQPGQKTGHGFA